MRFCRFGCLLVRVEVPWWAWCWKSVYCLAWRFACFGARQVGEDELRVGLGVNCKCSRRTLPFCGRALRRVGAGCSRWLAFNDVFGHFLRRLI